jgi:hypothetical protein
VSIEKTECFIVRCDGCEELFDADEYVVHYGSQVEAAQGVKDACGFVTADGKHYCEGCNEEGRIPGGVRCSCDQADPFVPGLGRIKRDAAGHRLSCALATATEAAD